MRAKLNPLLRVVLFFLITLAFIPSPKGFGQYFFEDNSQLKEVRNLHQEIMLYDLANDLNLTKEQIGRLLPILKEVENKREAHRVQAEEKLNSLKESFNKLKETLERGEKVSPEANELVQKKSQELRASWKSLIRELKPYETQVENILNPDQITKVENFKQYPLHYGKKRTGQPEQQKQAKHKDMRRMRGSGRARVAYLFFNPVMIKVLEKKLENYRS